VDEAGLPGLVRGTVRGISAAVVRPLAAALEASARVADSVRSAVSGGPRHAPRLRPPRCASPNRRDHTISGSVDHPCTDLIVYILR